MKNCFSISLYLAIAILAGMLVACGGMDGDSTAQEAGKDVTVTVKYKAATISNTRAVLGSPDISWVEFYVTPADLYKRVDGWDGNASQVAFILPEGEQTVFATAFNAADEPVASGSTTITVTDATAEIFINMLDVTGAPGLPASGPVITSIAVYGPTTLVPGETVGLEVFYWVPDDQEAATVSWSDSCSSGTLTAPGSAFTEWTSDPYGYCQLSATVTAFGLSDTESVLLTVEPGVGVNAEFTPQPVFQSVTLSGGDPAFSYTLVRDAEGEGLASKTVPDPLSAGGAPVRIEGTIAGDHLIDGDLTITDSCGGEFLALEIQEDGTFGVDWYPLPGQALYCTLIFDYAYSWMRDGFLVYAYVAEGYTGDWPPEETPADPPADTVPEGAWKDDASGLIWEITPSAPNDYMTPTDAIAHCDSLALGGLTDWRLPNIDELRSLLRGCSKTVTGGSCNAGLDTCLSSSCANSDCNGCSWNGGKLEGCYWPDGMLGSCSFYLSSTPEDGGDKNWAVGFAYGTVRHFALMSGNGAVRCVR